MPLKLIKGISLLIVLTDDTASSLPDFRAKKVGNISSAADSIPIITGIEKFNTFLNSSFGIILSFTSRYLYKA